ncbi:hypothetical protein [Herbidospora mongoliensis]|uniref:hypothetical protein n=1 Tax=Herbidospora mongoliensis TaxID=688067 RepID=UPI000AB572C3|nr:hypothetical protein [Herbidospora mongoliensis]
MFAATQIRRACALGFALVTTGTLGIVGLAQPANATVAVLNATVDCLNVNYSGDTRDWYPYSVQVYTSPPSSAPSLVAVPATHAFQFAKALPDGATSVGISALCSSGHYPPGDFSGSTSITGIPAGTTAITASVTCTTAPVYPGPWLTTCSVQSVSFS